MTSNTKKTLKLYLKHAARYKWTGIISVLGIIGATVSDTLVPIYYKKFFDIISSEGARQVIAKEAISVLMMVGLLFLSGWCFWRLSSFATTYFQSRTIADLSNTCFTYLHQHSFSFFNDNFVGSLVKKVKWFSNGFEDIADRFVFELFPLAIRFLIIFFVLFGRNVWLGAAILAWIVLFMAVSFIFSKYKLRYDIERNEAETASGAILADTVTNNANVKLFNGYSVECSNFSAATEKLRRLTSWCWNLSNIFEAIQGALMISLQFGVLYGAIVLWKKGLLTAGDFVLIQSYLMIIFNNVRGFGRMIRRIYERLADAEEMTAILDTPHEVRDAKGAKNLKVSKGKIEFKDVSFCYRQTREIFEDFNLSIEPKERVALIGPSGAGKSTIVKLLLRNHNLSAGKILIDGQDISKVTLESLWENISLVPQDPILFHRTLMENIRYGRHDATDKEVIKAAKAAHAHDFISQFPEGYNTYVGERGVKLSGGERQRVAIARAILRNAPILVLDEATSSLDSESEKLIQEALDKLMKGKVVIVIAHRLSTIRKMDRIITIDGGRVIEQGTHEELMKNKASMYKRLWDLQAGGFI